MSGKSFSGITGRKRAETELTILSRIAQVFLTVPDDEMYGEILDIVRQVLESPYGVFGFTAENGDLVIPSMTRGIWKECQVPDKSIVFPPTTWGDSLWGRAIRNRKSYYANRQFKVPPGHIPVKSFLTVPVVFQDLTIGLLSMGNRPGGYSAQHQRLLKKVAGFISPILQARQQRDRHERERRKAEEALQREHLFKTGVIEGAAEGLCVCHEIAEYPYVRFTIWNERMKEITGYSLEEINRSGWYQSVYPDPEVQARAVERMQRMRLGDNLRGEEWEITRSDGAKRTLSIFTSVIALAENEHQVLALMSDITERKRAEEALRISEEKYRSIVETTTEWIWEMDLHGCHTYTNRRIESILGYPVAEFLQQNALDFMESQDRNLVLTRLPELIASKQGWRDWIIRWRHKDGSFRYLESNADPIVDTAGNLLGYRGADRDITERKRAEDELRQLNRALLTISECNQVLVRAKTEKELLDQICRIIVEQGGYRLAWVGYAEIDEGKTVRPVAQAGFKTGYLEALHLTWADIERGCGPTGTAIRTGQPCLAQNILTDPLFAPWQGEAIKCGYASSLALPLFVGKTVFGALNIYSARPDAFDTKEIALLTELANDLAFGVTTLRNRAERQQAEEALRESENKYRILVEQSLMGIGLSRGNQIIFANPALLSIYGYDNLEEFAKISLLDHTAPSSRNQIATRLREVDRGETQRTDFEFDILRKDGKTRTLHAITTHITSGSEIYTQAVFQDITERKIAEIERANLKEQFQQAQKMESVGRLAGGVAHDFNNMLQTILGNVDLALNEAPPGSSLRETLEEIQKSAQRSADLTRQLLAFARKQTIQPRVLSLNDTVSSIFKMLQRLIGEDIQLSWVPGVDLWSINMDPGQVDQVLANLIVNARDAIDGTGKVTIETANVTLDDSYTCSHPECAPGDYVMLAISDTGRGMDEKTRAHIFEPFFTTKEIGKGTGLGLATVFGIVKQNNGFINVYSESGQGTVFKLYFPRADVEAGERAQPSALHPLSGTETILLVEDEEQILNLGQRILKKHGFTVLVARTPEEALTLAAQHQDLLHLLVTDVVMPGMNGKELWQRLLTRYPGLKCLFMSGYTSDVIAHHGILDEGVDFLQKPFTSRKLVERIREALERG